MLGELSGGNGGTSCIHVNNSRIKNLSHLNGQNGHAGQCRGLYETLTQPFSHMVMRNPKLFYEAAFIARPKLQDALNFRNSRHRTVSQQQSQSPFNHQHEKVTAHSPPSSTGTGYTGSGLSTPDSLKGNLRKDVSVERKGEVKKRVQFNLQLKPPIILADDNDDTDEEDGEEFDEIERSLMQGYSEYDAVGGLTNGHSSKKKPSLRLDFGVIAESAPSGKGEPIDAELPLDQQTWYFGTISRQEAEEILRNCSEGSYIVRACELASRRDYSLAIKSSCGFMHLRIHRQPDDLYRLADFNRVFFTVPDLIEYYSCEKLPIRGAECTILLHPVHQQLL